MEYVAAVTAVVTLITELITLGYKAASLLAEAKKKGWVKEGRALTAIISEAKTDEERAILARRLFEHNAD